ncbi:MAG: hypothetical protein HKN74_13745 [Acidimicrobiia bacterium]|nr:hypothetical protein [Acidimicrobiia bacterium]MBT8216052.1 hypothetical protein [Acidimicrobiia bacterium]NNF11338.1 hypothetical protein [Acidimicrobiia bacterium]NNL71046.1 hypothetical protein [Acidimicrobiia bacterium]
MGWVAVDGVVVAGHGVASGQGGDRRFPAGTLAVQAPFFREAGIDLSDYHPGTINVSIRSHRFAPHRPVATVQALAWHDGFPPEDFSFFRCRVGEDGVAGLIYYPHPETKPDHHQDPSVLEVLAPFVPGIRVGRPLRLEIREEEWTLQPIDR